MIPIIIVLQGYLHPTSASQSLVGDEVQFAEIGSVWKVSRRSAGRVLRGKVNGQLSFRGILFPFYYFILIKKVLLTLLGDLSMGYLFSFSQRFQLKRTVSKRRAWISIDNRFLIWMDVLVGACSIRADATWEAIVSVCARLSPSTLTNVTCVVFPSGGDRRNFAVSWWLFGFLSILFTSTIKG